MPRRLKALAKNLKVPVIALSQLNRESENRINPVPALSQLRESGQLEQDADVAIFIDRPEQRDKTDRPGEADLIIGKNRDGETGTVTVAWPQTQKSPAITCKTAIAAGPADSVLSILGPIDTPCTPLAVIC